MPEDAGVVDVVDTSTDTIDTSTDTTDVSADSSTDATTEVDTSAETGGESTQGAAPGLKDVQAHLKELKATNPRLAKMLNDAFFRQSEFTKEFPDGLTGARAMKAAFEALGGPEGLEGLQQRSQLLDNVDADIASGNPKVIDDIAKDSPEGFKKLASPFLSKLQQLDPKAFSTTLRPHFVASLEQAGLPDFISQVQAALQKGDGEAIGTLTNNLSRWLGGLKQEAAAARTNQPDPERQKFEQERSQFNTEKENSFRQDIGRQNSDHMTAEVNKMLSSYLKGKPLSDAGKKDITAGIRLEIQRQLKADKTYQANVKALLGTKTRDQGKIVRFINAKLSEIAPKAVKSVWEARYGLVKATTRTGVQQTAAKGAPTGQIGGNQVAVQVAKKPEMNSLDLTKDPRMLLFMTGKGYMKDRSRVV